MIYIVYIALIIVTFLISLNGFLRGTKNSQGDIVLSMLLVGLIASSFYLTGWKYGLLTIFITYIFSPLTRPLAARLASRLYAINSDRKGNFVGFPSRTLERIFHVLGKPFDVNQIVKEINSGNRPEDAALKELFAYCSHKPKLQVLLDEFKVSFQDFKELYWQLIKLNLGQWTCGHWVAASALVYPETLQYLLMKKKEDIQEKTAINLILYFEVGAPLETSDF